MICLREALGGTTLVTLADRAGVPVGSEVEVITTVTSNGIYKANIITKYRTGNRRTVYGVYFLNEVRLKDEGEIPV